MSYDKTLSKNKVTEIQGRNFAWSLFIGLILTIIIRTDFFDTRFGDGFVMDNMFEWVVGTSIFYMLLELLTRVYYGKEYIQISKILSEERKDEIQKELEEEEREKRIKLEQAKAAEKRFFEQFWSRTLRMAKEDSQSEPRRCRQPGCSNRVMGGSNYSRQSYCENCLLIWDGDD